MKVGCREIFTVLHEQPGAAGSGPSGAAVPGVAWLGPSVLSRAPGTSRWEGERLAFGRCLVVLKPLQSLERSGRGVARLMVEQ